MKYLILLLCILLFSCDSARDKEEPYLSGSGKYIKLNTSGSINPKTRHLHYLEAYDRSWLLYGNRDRNELIIYSLPTGKIEKKIRYAKIGPHGIGSFRGALAKNFDSIIVSSATHYNDIFLTDTSGMVLNRYSLERIEGQKYKPAIEFFYSFSQNVIDGSIINLSTYVFSDVENQNLHNEIISFDYDLKNKRIASYYYFPKFQNTRKQALTYFNRAFNGKNFVYSFGRADELYLQKSKNNYQIYPGKSKYRRKSLDWIVNATDPIIKQKSNVIGNPMYRGIIYDEYQDVFYRFFIPGINVDNYEEIEKFTEYPKQFSIQVFDKDLNLLTATLFPENTYDPYLGFVSNKGLYLALHCDHPLYNPDSLAFERIDLVKK